MAYPVAIEPGDANTAFGVIVPDLPGCFSAGDTQEEALENSTEAIELHLQGLAEDAAPIPTPSDIATYADEPQFCGLVWAISPWRGHPTG